MKLLNGAVTVDERAWYVLEGPSCPDVYLESDELVVVIEGKRNGASSHDDYDLDAGSPSNAATPRRRVGRSEATASFSAFSLSKVTHVTAWRFGSMDAKRRATQRHQSALALSMPHQSPDDQQRIGNAFIGVTTWQAVCRALSIPEAVLIHEVV